MRIYARALAALLGIALAACTGGRRCGPCAPPCPPPACGVPTTTPHPGGPSPTPPDHPAYGYAKPCAAHTEPGCRDKKPCKECWPRYYPAGTRSSAERYLDRLEKIAWTAASSPPEVCDSACRMRWTALAAYAKSLRTHGKTCKRFTCHQLYERVVKAYAEALAGDPKAAFDAIYHKDPLD